MTEDEGDWDEPEFDDEGIEDELPEEEQSEEAEFEPIIEEKPDRLQKLKRKTEKTMKRTRRRKRNRQNPHLRRSLKPKDEKKPEEKKPEPSVIEAPEDADDTTGMNFVQKAQYRAKMRRREQTRLRRENARRIQEGAEVTYQPMTRLDMQSVGARLAAAAIVLVAGIAMGDSSAALPLCLLAFLITALPIAARVLTQSDTRLVFR